MSIVEMVFSEPKSTGDWLYPMLIKICYWILIVAVAVCFVVLAVRIYHISDFWEALCLFVLYVVSLLILRVAYELSILLFRIYEALCAQIQLLNRLLSQTDEIRQKQTVSAQYTCDRLADICDSLKEGL